ncbi:hypothetical protein RJ639_019505 [Escallonia herrerae]|uniref:RST domain-containing protein n=1 Tax=Escallonia herrerae TaxID=1293975 RepID=A0AA88VBG2_9ASTE|nr:hypothetical protein RJ639_019505 [Escallonia herrerae]
MEKKCGGNANLKFAWYGGSKDEISEIIKYGFGHSHGCGVYLTPDDSPVESVESSVPDKDELRHVCFVAYCWGGRSLFVQVQDSIVLVLRSLILVPPKKPTSLSMPFSTLISALLKFLPAHSISLIAKHHRDYRDNKISQHELIRQIRYVAGDKLLTAVIKSKGTMATNNTKLLSRTSEKVEGEGPFYMLGSDLLREDLLIDSESELTSDLVVVEVLWEMILVDSRKLELNRLVELTEIMTYKQLSIGLSN